MLLTGCGPDLQAIPQIPDALLDCAASPAIPGDTATQRDVSVYVIDLHDAHADCKSKLGRVKVILNTK